MTVTPPFVAILPALVAVLLTGCGPALSSYKATSVPDRPVIALLSVPPPEKFQVARWSMLTNVGLGPLAAAAVAGAMQLGSDKPEDALRSASIPLGEQLRSSTERGLGSRTSVIRWDGWQPETSAQELANADGLPAEASLALWLQIAQAGYCAPTEISSYHPCAAYVQNW